MRINEELYSEFLNSLRPEAVITINGIELTQGQSMTFRVALCNMLEYLDSDEGLGDDEYGRLMTKAYKERIGEIFHIMGNK